MSKIYENITELVGNTPLFRAKNLEKKLGLDAKIFLKLEYFNPTGSVKDRAAREIIEDAEKKGRLTAGATIIEPTSGNTGIGLAAIGVAKGYEVVIVMPDTMSKERIKIMSALGAKVILTDGKLGMKGAIAKAEEMNAEIDGSIVAGQFTNQANPDAHYRTTGPEIYEDMDGKVDVLVAGIGTGGTVTGTGKYLKEKIKELKIVAVEPENSPVLSKGTAGKHAIQGIGAGFIPEILDTKVFDEIFTVSDEAAVDTARELAATEGILTGISSGAALNAALAEAGKKENAGKNIVCVLPDSADRYFSTALFE